MHPFSQLRRLLQVLARSATEVLAAPNAPPLVVGLGALTALDQDWTVGTQRDGDGPLGVGFTQPKVMGCRIRAVGACVRRARPYRAGHE